MRNLDVDPFNEPRLNINMLIDGAFITSYLIGTVFTSHNFSDIRQQKVHDPDLRHYELSTVKCKYEHR